MAEPNSPQEAVEQHRAAQAQGATEKAAPRFKIGDVVVLRSGGPRMTVSGVGLGAEPTLTETSWFIGEVLEGSAFFEAELEHAPPKETP